MCVCARVCARVCVRLVYTWESVLCFKMSRHSISQKRYYWENFLLPSLKLDWVHSRTKHFIWIPNRRSGWDKNEAGRIFLQKRILKLKRYVLKENDIKIFFICLCRVMFLRNLFARITMGLEKIHIVRGIKLTADVQ